MKYLDPHRSRRHVQEGTPYAYLNNGPDVSRPRITRPR
jgi:hypothetical protein